MRIQKKEVTPVKTLSRRNYILQGIYSATRGSSQHLSSFDECQKSEVLVSFLNQLWRCSGVISFQQKYQSFVVSEIYTLQLHSLSQAHIIFTCSSSSITHSLSLYIVWDYFFFKYWLFVIFYSTINFQIPVD